MGFGDLETAGYAASVLIGVALGLIGGGGSILTVPVLVYLFQEPTSVATAYSLFIVGLTALAGSFAYIQRNQVNFRVAGVFGVPSILSVYVVRAYVVPALPADWFQLGAMTVTRDNGILLIFAILMFGTAISMIRDKNDDEGEGTAMNGQLRFSYGKILLDGIIVGAITGLVGAGGGFLIIPALVILAKLPIKQAVGTSLVIIAAKSLLGFLGDIQSSTSIEWPLLTSISAMAILGIAFGAYVSQYVSSQRLKPAFGYFVLFMGLYMVGKELLPPLGLVSAVSKSAIEYTQSATNGRFIMRQISPIELHERMKGHEAFVLLDVREDEERAISVLPNDVHIPMDSVPLRLGELDKSAAIVVYCRSGRRSAEIAQLLFEAGFQDVYNLDSGINGYAMDIDPTLQTY